MDIAVVVIAVMEVPALIQQSLGQLLALSVVAVKPISLLIS